MRISRHMSFFVCGIAALAAGCAPNSNTPGNSSSTPAAATSKAPATPSVSASEWQLPERDPKAIATFDIKNLKHEGRTGQADAKTTYMIHAACTGTSSMSYQVHVNNKEVTSGTVTCGEDTLSSAFSGLEGLVNLSVHVDSADASKVTGFADIQPATSS